MVESIGRVWFEVLRKVCSRKSFRAAAIRYCAFPSTLVGNGWLHSIEAGFFSDCVLCLKQRKVGARRSVASTQTWYQCTFESLLTKRKGARPISHILKR